MSSRTYHLASMALIFIAIIVYIVVFACTGWLSDDSYDYGFWKRCETNHTSSQQCHHLGLANQAGYFEASRTFGTFALVSYIFCIVSSFLEENEGDTGMRRTCYRHIFCLLCLITVVLQVSSMIALAAGYEDDPNLTHAKAGWCFAVAVLATCLALLSCLCRYKYISMEHNLAYSGDCCFNCKEDRTKTTPLNLPLDISYRSDDSMENGRSKLPPMLIRRTSSATSDGLEGRLTRLPPLPFKTRGGLPRSSSLRSTDSGLDSRDISRDSILDEATGPLPLSVEMLRRHDRRLSGATGRREDRRRRAAFSSTTSLSTTDSQSSAELAPRVHTPTNKKRVHYSIPQNPSFHPDGSESVPPPADYQAEVGGVSAAEHKAPPIISFPIKTQGVELSRAKTNSRITATIDNVSLASSVARQWKDAVKSVQEAGRGTSGDSAQDGAQAHGHETGLGVSESKSADKKEKKNKKKKEKKEKKKSKERKKESEENRKKATAK